jgi:DNA-binding NtrC family response regulator
MDDEPSVRETCHDIISFLGYDVDCTEDGEELINFYKQALEENIHIDAVVVDLTVPGKMGGKEAFQKLKEIDKNVVGIVSSGYTDDSTMSNYKDFGFSGIIVKPYQVDDMAEVLAAIIK